LSWAYYNEFDPQKAAWLRELIKAGHIAPGEVDERSIELVQPGDLAGFSQHHWFAGIGVWSYALRRAGWDDTRPIWTASLPCQPFSAAGKQGGFTDERHLWPHVFRLIQECRPECVIGEQSGAVRGREWLDLVFHDLEGNAYTCGAVITRACGFGASHQRQRLYFVGRRAGADADEGDGDGRGCFVQVGRLWSPRQNAQISLSSGAEWRTEPRPCLLAHGYTRPMVNLCARGFGDAIVAPQAEAFIRAVMECL
jgi:site-specific DNA-cytosine methylase